MEEVVQRLNWRPALQRREVLEPNFDPPDDRPPQFVVPSWQVGPEPPPELKLELQSEGHLEVMVMLLLEQSEPKGNPSGAVRSAAPTPGQPIPRWAQVPTGRPTTSHTDALSNGRIGGADADFSFQPEGDPWKSSYEIGEHDGAKLEGEIQLRFRPPDWTELFRG